MHTDSFVETVQKSRSGGGAATGLLTATLYEALRARARRALTLEAGPQSLQATDLAHGVLERLLDGAHLERVQDRAHLYRLFARVMRNYLVDRARRNHAVKRGAGHRSVRLSEIEEPLHLEDHTRTIAVAEACTKLASEFPRPARVVEMRYLAGLSVRQTAEALSVSERTVADDWCFARAWLYDELGEGEHLVADS